MDPSDDTSTASSGSRSVDLSEGTSSSGISSYYDFPVYAVMRDADARDGRKRKLLALCSTADRAKRRCRILNEASCNSDDSFSVEEWEIDEDFKTFKARMRRRGMLT